MAHNNSTPASVLTAPISQSKLLVGTTLITDKNKQVTRESASYSNDYTVAPITGQIRNKNRAARKLAAKTKRSLRNKDGRKQKRRNG